MLNVGYLINHNSLNTRKSYMVSYTICEDTKFGFLCIWKHPWGKISSLLSIGGQRGDMRLKTGFEPILLSFLTTCFGPSWPSSGVTFDAETVKLY
jgi:hypothetical protein